MKDLRLLLLGLAGIAVLVLLGILLARRGGSVEVRDNSADVQDLIAERRGEDHVAPERDGLVHAPLTEEVATGFFPALTDTSRNVYDPLTHFRSVGGFHARLEFPEHPAGEWVVTTNSLGLRNLEEPRAKRPHLRVLVTGDSHTDGMVPISELFTYRLQRKLRAESPGRKIEVLNAGRGGYSFYNYLGVLEKYAPLEPHVFVMAVYGGNDFTETGPLYAYYERRELEAMTPDWNDRLRLSLEHSPDALAQGMNQMARFLRGKAVYEFSMEASLAVTGEVQRACAREGIRLVVLLIPSMIDTQRRYVEEQVDLLSRVFDLQPAQLGIVDRFTDEYLAAVRELGIEVVDMRADLRATEEPAYWVSDLHLNTLGHEIVSERLVPVVRPAR